MSEYTFANSTQAVPSEENIPVNFSIKAGPSTDVWEKPPSTKSFNAPILYRAIPLKYFKRARVSITANWKTLYDQGGLILVIHKSDGERKWIKTGIEFTHGKAHLSTVVKDRWADWSLLPVPSGGGAATIEVARESDGSLWIYLVEGISRAPIREVTWVFEDEASAECWIGPYVAKPAKDGDDLVVDFRHLIVETL
jgi:regulation of enolase protein 1 (concanavalin A-like superfamily)